MLPYKILRVFEGSEGSGCTNSCTVLVEIPQDRVAQFESRIVIIKSFDPRFSTYTTDLCVNVAYPATFDPDKEDRQDFLRWFYGPVPQKNIQESKYLQSLVGGSELSRTHYYGDAVRSALRSSRVMDRLVTTGILPSLSDEMRQLVAEETCIVNCEYEYGVVAQATRHDLTGTFPKFLCQGCVECPSATQTLDGIAMMPHSGPHRPGLRMLRRKVDGGRTSTQMWQVAHYSASRPERRSQSVHNKLATGPVLADAVHGICRRQNSPGPVRSGFRRRARRPVMAFWLQPRPVSGQLMLVR